MQASKPVTIDRFLADFHAAPLKQREAALNAAVNALNHEEYPILIPQAQFCRAASVSRWTLRRWEAAGIIHPVIIGGVRRYRRSELLKLAGEVE